MLLTKEEYLHDNNSSFIAATSQYSEPKFACPNCKDGGMCKDLRKILASYPPQYEYKCNKCRHIEYLYC